MYALICAGDAPWDVVYLDAHIASRGYRVLPFVFPTVMCGRADAENLPGVRMRTVNR